MIQIFDVGKQRNIRMKLFLKRPIIGKKISEIEVIFTLETNEKFCNKIMNCENGIDDIITVLSMRFVSLLIHIDSLQCSWFVSFLQKTNFNF